MEYQSKCFVLREGNHAAMVFDAPVGGPAVKRSGQTVETFQFQLAPILTPSSQLSAQKPRPLDALSPDAQAHRLPDQSESANLSYV